MAVGAPAEVRLTAGAKVLYEKLLKTSRLCGYRCRLKVSDLQIMTGLSRRTIITHLGTLKKAGFVEKRGQSEYLVHEVLPNGVSSRVKAVMDRINFSRNRGEAIGLEYLTLFVADDRFLDNRNKGDLRGASLSIYQETDRFYYVLRVVVEIDGRQHETTTERFPSASQLAKQQANDLMKAEQCRILDLKLIRIPLEDIHPEGMLKHIRGVLPVRDVPPDDEVLLFLNEVSKSYLRAMESGVSADGLK